MLISLTGQERVDSVEFATMRSERQQQPMQTESLPPLTERAEILLRSLIQRYIMDGQPVGSRVLAREAGLDISPATVRNVMSDLEELGLITSPHTSAGRIPTQKGYRFFVDTLLKIRTLDNRALDEIEDRLSGDLDPGHLLERTSELLSTVTHFAGMVLMPGGAHTSFKQLEFLPLSSTRALVILITEDGRVQNRVISTNREYTSSELVEAANYCNARFSSMPLSAVRRALLGEIKEDSEELSRLMRTAAEMAQGLFGDLESTAGEVVLRGEENLLDVPELCDLEKLRRLFDIFKTKHDLLELLDKSMKASGVSIFIGEESGYRAFNECSVITAPYEVDGRCVGTLGVIGPTRMSYGDVIPIVDVTARFLGSALSAIART